MRIFLFAICLVAAGIGSPALGTEPSNQKLQQLSWMLGTWQRVGLSQGSNGYERWSAQGDALIGIGVLEKNGRIAFEERLRLEVEAGQVFYVADVEENPKPVRFRLVSQANAAAVFENPEHDFPKRIAYRLGGDRLEVVTSGNGREVVFHFRRSAHTGPD